MNRFLKVKRQAVQDLRCGLRTPGKKSKQHAQCASSRGMTGSKQFFRALLKLNDAQYFGHLFGLIVSQALK